MTRKPAWERSDEELHQRMRDLAASGPYDDSPASIMRELNRRADERDRHETLRIARIALAVSIIGLLLSFAAIARGLLA